MLEVAAVSVDCQVGTLETLLCIAVEDNYSVPVYNASQRLYLPDRDDNVSVYVYSIDYAVHGHGATFNVQYWKSHPDEYKYHVQYYAECYVQHHSNDLSQFNFDNIPNYVANWYSDHRDNSSEYSDNNSANTH